MGRWCATISRRLLCGAAVVGASFTLILATGATTKTAHAEVCIPLGCETLSSCLPVTVKYGTLPVFGKHVCHAVIQRYMNDARDLRLLFGQPVGAGWTHLSIDGIYGGWTTYAVHDWKYNYYRAGDLTKVDNVTLNAMNLQCVGAYNNHNLRYWSPACHW